MALSEKHRSTMYEYFAPRLGEDVTEAFIGNFPRGQIDEPITREYLDLRLEAMLGRITTLFLAASTVIVAAVVVSATVVIAALG